MNRRRFAIAVASATVISPRIASATIIPPVEFEAEDFAAVSYRGRAYDDTPIRSIGARISRWTDAEAAEEFRQAVIAGAGSNLPEGEFYQSEPAAHPLPAEFPNLPATIMGWNTTVGVAAYHTDWVLLAVRRDALVWDVRVSGAEPKPVLDFAGTIVAPLAWREAEGDLFSLLPGQDEVPDALSLDYTMSPNGAFDPQGTPIPHPHPNSGCRVLR